MFGVGGEENIVDELLRRVYDDLRTLPSFFDWGVSDAIVDPIMEPWTQCLSTPIVYLLL